LAARCQRGEVQAGGPALGSLVDGSYIVAAQVDVKCTVQQRGRLVHRKSEVPDLAEVAVGTEAAEPHRAPLVAWELNLTGAVRGRRT